jgi:hypothetical protein
MRILCLLLAGCGVGAAGDLAFRAHTIATGLKDGYQVVPVDLNGDGKPDLIALASGMDELVWFENPGWQRHTIVRGMNGMINAAATDIDGDGVPEIALAYGFDMVAAKSAGIVSLLHRGSDPSGLWSIKEIDQLTTSHRLRWADIDGSGRKTLVNAPLTGAKALASDYRDKVPLVVYRGPEWKREVASEANEGVMHGIFPVEWGGRGRDSILTASFSGIHRYWLEGSTWRREEIAKGDPGTWPHCGASDVAAGRLGSERFLAAIEPWHGNQVAVYRVENGAWKRTVIEDGLPDSHSIAIADLDGDGQGEIVVAQRGKPGRVLVFALRGGKWAKTVVDEGITAASCAVADLNGDGRPDLVCIGSATENLKWYENLGPAR